MASNSKNLGELLNTTTTVSPAFVSDQDNTSTGYFDLPNGTTAQRPSGASGMIRYNSTINLTEYYDGSSWKAIDTPPSITTVSPDNFDTAGDVITINGSFFASGATVKVIANDGQEFSPDTVTHVNSSQVTFVITSAMVSDDNDPYDVKITNPSGLSYNLENALDFAPEPAWTKSAGSLGTISAVGASSVSITTGATSTESDATITYAVTTGSLPSGLSIASGTGTITGSATAVGSNTTSNFTLTATATDGSGNTTTNTRQYSITVNAPVITSYTSTGSGTFTVPSGVSAVNVLVVAGGGSGGCDTGGGGGAGGLIYRPAFPVTPGGSVAYTVGAGGPYNPTVEANQSNGISGQNSVFGTLTAQGGGGGVSGFAATQGMSSGGSGGGGRRNQSSTLGAGTQPQAPGDSGTYGFGNPGWTGDTDTFGSGGGGGAGAAATTSGSRAHGYNQPIAPYLQDGGGGAGKAYSISGSSVNYAGGGGGGTENLPGAWRSGGGPGGGGHGGYRSAGPGYGAADGIANRGSGGGGAGQNPEGGNGGSGVIIVSY